MSPVYEGEWFPDYEPDIPEDELCSGCYEFPCAPYEDHCEACLDIISGAATDLCSVPTAPLEEQTCKDCGTAPPAILGRCKPCDLAKFGPMPWTKPAPVIPPFDQEATSHPAQARTLTRA